MQTNKNLLLSKDAGQLEAGAGDLRRRRQCRHGSTIGQLDDAAMF
jgi:hypothetical protein